MPDYRERIYASYVSAHAGELAPTHINGLRSRAPYLQKLIREHFPQDHRARIVDIGCGHGALIHFLRQAGYENLSGFDRSPEQVAAAERLGISGVQERDIFDALESLPLGSCDVIVAFDVIEHLRKDEIQRFVDRIFRVLKPGGRFVVHTVNGESPMAGSVFYGDFTHETCFNRISIGQLLRATGFHSVACFEDAPVVHGLKSAVRFALWKAIRAALRSATAAETGSLGREAIFTRNFLTVAFK